MEHLILLVNNRLSMVCHLNINIATRLLADIKIEKKKSLYNSDLVMDYK